MIEYQTSNSKYHPNQKDFQKPDNTKTRKTQTRNERPNNFQPDPRKKEIRDKALEKRRNHNANIEEPTFHFFGLTHILLMNH